MTLQQSKMPPADDDSLDQIEEYYDEYGSWYETERRRGYYEIINDLEFEKIAESVRDRDVLEIGCGTGLLLERTNGIAKSAKGIDLSEGMLETSRRKGLDVQQASAMELPFPNECFDVTYSFKVFPHIPDVEQALREACRVTKRTGRLFIEFYNPYSFKAISNSLSFRIHGQKVYCRFDDLSKIRAYLPPSWRIKSTRGIRILAPVASCYTVPGVGFVFRWMERKLCDTSLRRFGGYFVVEIEPAHLES